MTADVPSSCSCPASDPWSSRDSSAKRRAHLIGIAGTGMRSLAEVLLGWGWELSGSDCDAGPAEFLAAEGVRICAGHAASHVPEQTELVIHSDAIPADNPERLRADELRIPTCSYFQMLGRLMASRQGIAVAGTHGKSTTAAMLAEMLVRAGLDPTVVFGAAPLGRNSGGRPGRSELMVAEACEYRANFLHLRPQHAVILAIEPDHFDCFDTREQLESAFSRFAASLPAHGLLLVPHGCPAAARAVAASRCRIETFGLDPAADWSARDVAGKRARYSFAVFHRGHYLCDAPLRVPGKHNVANALAAAALAWANGVPPEQITSGLGWFRGLHRRLEAVGSWRGVVLIDDYAHHPTEVAAGLQTVRRMYPGRRLWCVFQPHQASRTRRLLDELASSLQNADKVVVAEIFRAREPPRQPGEVAAADLARAVGDRGTDVAAVHTTEGIVRWLETELGPGDVLITMGAGDIRRICDGFIDRLREDRAAG